MLHTPTLTLTVWSPTTKVGGRPKEAASEAGTDRKTRTTSHRTNPDGEVGMPLLLAHISPTTFTSGATPPARKMLAPSPL